MAEASHHRLLQLPRSPNQLGCAGSLSSRDHRTLAFFEIKKDAAPGVDGLTWQDYEADLDCNIEDLHDRVHSGAYRAQPSRRLYIPKPDGRQRPIAIAALEDKI